MLHALINGLGLGLLLAIAVGPIIFSIIKISLGYGKKAGYAFITGVCLCDAILILLGNVAAEAMRSALQYKNLIGIIGGCLFIVMGIYSFFFGKKPDFEKSAHIKVDYRKRDMAKFTLQGFFINLFNPGPLLFWLTTCTTYSFLNTNERILLFSTTLAVVFLTDFLKVNLAQKIKRWLTPHNLAKLHKATALILTLCGVIIASSVIIKNYINW